MTVVGVHTVSFGSGGVVFACAASAGSDCRLLCAAGCVDAHMGVCDGTTTDSGSCNVLVDLEAVEAPDTYIGGIAVNEWRAGPIEVVWSDDAEGYQWRFACEALGVGAGRAG